MRLLARGGGPFRPLAAAGWAVTWAAGAAGGVGLGAFLTVVSGSGAPGAQALTPGRELVFLPLASGAAVFVVHYAGQVAAALFRGGPSGREPRAR